MENLIGRRVDAVWLSDDKTFVTVTADKQHFTYYTDADCCSSSWINHLSGVANLLGQVVRGVDAPIAAHTSLESGDADLSGIQEYERIYSVKLTTDRGVCELEFRNASNGYYGGSLVSRPAPPPDARMVLVTEDF